MSRDDQVLFVCSEHSFTIVASGYEISSRGSPGHRVTGCERCDGIVDEAFDLVMAREEARKERQRELRRQRKRNPEVAS